MAQPSVPRKLTVFVDGFNLYYGLLKANPGLKWLDIRKLVRMQFPSPNIAPASIKYFTAKVDDDGRSRCSQAHARQTAYWAALDNDKVEIIEGRIEHRERECRAAQCAFGGDRWFRAPIEKMTDVNIALQIVRESQEIGDGFLCVISGDTDLLPALKMAHAIAPKSQKRVYVPCTEEDLSRRRVDEFTRAGWWTRRLPSEHLSSARFPNFITKADGVRVDCPEAWLPNINATAAQR